MAAHACDAYLVVYILLDFVPLYSDADLESVILGHAAVVPAFGFLVVNKTFYEILGVFLCELAGYRGS